MSEEAPKSTEGGVAFSGGAGMKAQKPMLFGSGFEVFLIAKLEEFSARRRKVVLHFEGEKKELSLMLFVDTSQFLGFLISGSNQPEIRIEQIERIKYETTLYWLTVHLAKEVPETLSDTGLVSIHLRFGIGPKTLVDQTISAGYAIDSETRMHSSIMADINGSYGAKGVLSEMVVTSGISAAEREQLLGYFREKHGVAV